MKKLLLAACAVLAMTGVARGEDGKLWGRSGPWNFIQLPPKSNACLAVINPGHDTLIIASDVNGKGRIVFGRDTWKLPDGKYTVTGRLDGGDPVDLQAFTTTENSLASDFEWTEAVLRNLSTSNTLTIVAGTQTLSFSLVGSAKMLPELFRCVGEIRAAAAANPFAGQAKPQPAAPVSTPSNPFKRT